MTDTDRARLVDLDLLISSLRGEARLADRPGQHGRLNAAADVVVDAVEYIQRLIAERDALAAQLDALRAGIERLATDHEAPSPSTLTYRAKVAADLRDLLAGDKEGA